MAEADSANVGRDWKITGGVGARSGQAGGTGDRGSEAEVANATSPSGRCLKLIEAIEKGAESAQIASVKGNAKSS